MGNSNGIIRPLMVDNWELFTYIKQRAIEIVKNDYANGFQVEEKQILGQDYFIIDWEDFRELVVLNIFINNLHVVYYSGLLNFDDELLKSTIKAIAQKQDLRVRDINIYLTDKDFNPEFEVAQEIDNTVDGKTYLLSRIQDGGWWGERDVD